MEGRGVVNYDTNKPSISYTTKTTQFDDELLKRGIITFEQAMLAKGATQDEALRLVQLKQEEDEKQTKMNDLKGKQDSHHSRKNSQDDDDYDSSDDNFLESYRKKRLSELKQQQKTQIYGEVIHINRTNWNHEVNEASSDGTWVIIHLSAQNSSPTLHPNHLELCLVMENQIIPIIAKRHPSVKFVNISSRNAIENWPDDNLPTLFCYRYGSLQHQLVGLQELGYNATDRSLTVKKIEMILSTLGVLGTNVNIGSDEYVDIMDNDDDNRHYTNSNARSYFGSMISSTHSHDKKVDTTNYGRSKFGGGMTTFSTRLNGDDDESDYDDVD